jgi:DNA-binding protein WhiA
MGFSHEIKEEIIKKGVTRNCCKKAFLAGFIRSTGAIIKTDEGYGFECSTDLVSAMSYALRLMNEIYGYNGGETFSYADNLNKKTVYAVDCIGDDAVEVLFDLGILANADEGDEYELRLKSNKELLDKECCIKSFIKGMFIGSGFCSIPSGDINTKPSDGEAKTKTGYHLEVSFTHRVPASEFAGYLADFGILAKAIVRRKNVVVYIKNSNEIKDFLALINTPKAVLKITDTMVAKQFNNDLNRKYNCDVANIKKVSGASDKYAYAIENIDSTIGIDSLSDELQQVAEMRLAYREYSLAELAEVLGITKSCLNHRLRKIAKISEELE